jgi:hypothetical protein
MEGEPEMDCQFYRMLSQEFPEELNQLKARELPTVSFSNIFGEEIVPHFYERVRAVGFQPDAERLGAIIELRRPIGYGPVGSMERVKFYVDWHNSGEFTEQSCFAGEATFAAHDKECASEMPISYFVCTPKFTRPADAPELSTNRVRIILSWGEEITGPDFHPQWGHRYECRVSLNHPLS